MNTITPLSSTTSLGSATARPSDQSSAQKYLQSGEIFKAEVLDAMGKDLFTLDIRGTHVTAQSKAALSPGQTLQLQVVSTSPQVELKIVTSTPQQLFSRALTLIGENIDLGGLFQLLQKAPSAPPAQGLGQQAVILEMQALNTAATQEAAGKTPLAPQAAGREQGAGPFVNGGKAVVVEAQGKGVFTLDIAGTRVAVQSTVPLTVGETVPFEIAATSPQVELRLIPDGKAQTPGGVLTLVDKTIDPNLLLQALKSSSGSFLLDKLSTTSRVSLEDFFSLQQHQLAGKDGGEILKNLVERTGMSLENLLAKGDQENAVKTLKAALLEIAHVFKEAADISGATQRLLGTLESYQLAQLHLDQAAGLLFPLPLPFLEKGYLLVESYGRQKDGDEGGISPPLRFSLHLSLAELGNLRIDFLQYQDGVYIRFNTESKEKSEFVESFSAELKQAMSDKPLLGLSFSETATDPAADLLHKLLPDGSSMLDTKA